MKRWRTSLLLVAGVAAAGIAIPAAGQRDKGKTPESLLPPGFGEQPPPPRPKPPPAPPPPPAAPPAPSGNSPSGVSAEAPPPAPAAGPVESGGVEETNSTGLA